MTVNVAENNQEKTLNPEKVEQKAQPTKVDNQTVQNSNGQQQQPTTPETPEDPNWKAFREARKKDRAEREAAERRASEKEQEIAALKAAMEAAFSKSAPTPQAYQQYYGMNEQPEESEDQRIERKVNSLLAQKEAEAEKTKAEREQQEYPNRLVSAYPDFNHTISQENLDYLDYHYPEVSRPLQRLRDGFDKWSDIYLAIKKFVPNSTNAKREAVKADINTMKPKSIASTGLTQTQEAAASARLSEERKAANWERMQKIMKGV